MGMTGDKATRAVIEEAADWVVFLHESNPSAVERRRFMQWLKRSPVHVREFLQAEADWMALEGVDPKKATDVDRLVRGFHENVVSLFENAGKAVVRRTGRPVHLIAASLAGVAALALLLLLHLHLDPAEVYETALGEQRTVVLADGSVVELNTQSRIVVRAGREYRDIDLASGEALFIVAKDDPRPFRVFSDAIEVRATGTRFNVYRQSAQTVVTVLEGKVAVSQVETDDDAARSESGSGTGGVVELAAGDRAVARASAVTRSATADPRHAVAWRDRRLVFENDTLATVAREFNRYNGAQLVIEDEALAGRRVSGVFDADRPETMVRFLLRGGDVEAVQRRDGGWLLRPQL